MILTLLPCVCMEAGMYTPSNNPQTVLLTPHPRIRGEWPEEVDTTLMDIPPPPPSDEMIEPELTAKPDHPIIPPDNVDLHITLPL
jgi:hypothetical protein